ncbi:hypothetical protein [Methylomonas sp. AM2-LC]|uniref:hypothetical protein n=1 Tax=Methylomonas sp. AM2-LC TaxID=3153301 RepID=UPI00326394CD
MKYLISFIRYLIISSLFGILYAIMFLEVDELLCKSKSGQTAAGGGAAIGLLSLKYFFISWIVSMVILFAINIMQKYSLLKSNTSFSFKMLIVLGVTLVITFDSILSFWRSLDCV